MRRLGNRIMAVPVAIFLTVLAFFALLDVVSEIMMADLDEAESTE